MSAHLQELMEDCETFGWPLVRTYHTVWLPHLKQRRAKWNDEATRLKLHRELRGTGWHLAASPALHPLPPHRTLPPEP